ncbi:unnamed protein product [Danaus chrysippus]|uniref:(African queen) hypothetical protein n=1 Tax=Danaus chrysippus TaxID=151541 RepID=A0A8J2QHV7_9NEOP|nr:unnamed protein product [Danaus chrysippus]
MDLKLKLLLFLTIIVNCNGHLSILKDIIHTAHDRVHDTAKTILGGFNFDFHIGGHHRTPTPPPNYPPPETGDKTIVVVVENPTDQGPHDNGFRPTNNNNGQRPQYNGNRPHDNGYNGYNGYNNGNHQNNGGNTNNNHQYQPGYNGPNQNSPGYSNGNVDVYNKPNQIDQNYNNQGTPNYGNNNNAHIDPNYNQNVYPNNNNQNSPPSNPTSRPTEYTPTASLSTERPNQQTTKKPDNDAPFFVPLNPDGYIYTGDKIYTGGPKREVDSKPAENDDEFQIDIRLKDQ